MSIFLMDKLLKNPSRYKPDLRLLNTYKELQWSLHRLINFSCFSRPHSYPVKGARKVPACLWITPERLLVRTV